MTHPTEEQRAMILDSLGVGIALDLAARKAGATAAACVDLAASDPAWAAAMAAAREEGTPVEHVMTVREFAAMQAAEAAPKGPAYVPLAKSETYVPKPALAEGENIPDWSKFAKEAAEKYGPGRMGLYLKQDERLVARGLPATSDWWKWSISSYFDSGLVWLLVEAGRGAGKSTTLERFLLVVTIHTPRVVPPGQTWQLPFISVRPEDARRRIFELQAMLRAAYFIEAKPARDAITITDAHGNQIEIASMAATIGNVSGASTVGAILDEAAKLAIGGTNPDGEMVASLAETSRAREGWAGVRCSSAWETRGAHFASITEGTNLANFVATIGPAFIDECLAGHAIVAAWEAAQGNSHGAAQIRSFAKTLTPQSPNVPTWVANPTISALASRLMLETLPKDDASLDGLDRTTYWLRENGSMPLSREGGPDFAGQCMMSADITARITGRRRANPSADVNANGLLVDPHALPGDSRYGGPAPRGSSSLKGWRSRKVF